LLLLGEYSSPVRIEREVATRDDESNPAYAMRLLPSRLNTLLRAAESRPGTGKSKLETASQLARFVALWPDEMQTATQERRPQRVAKFVLETAEATRDVLAESRPDIGVSAELLRAALIVAENALRILGVEPKTNF
jgi:arginyl-tRNA synthetase